MPIEYSLRFPNIEEGGIVKAGEEVEFDHGHIEPGEALFIRDYIVDSFIISANVIIVECNEADDGAQVHLVEAEGLFDTADFSNLTKDDLPEDVETEYVDTETTYEEELTLEDGTDLILVARYTPPNEISEGFIVPSSLVNPN